MRLGAQQEQRVEAAIARAVGLDSDINDDIEVMDAIDPNLVAIFEEEISGCRAPDARPPPVASPKEATARGRDMPAGRRAAAFMPTAPLTSVRPAAQQSVRVWCRHAVRCRESKPYSDEELLSLVHHYGALAAEQVLGFIRK